MCVVNCFIFLIQVMVGQNIVITLSETLSYIATEVPLAIIIPSVMGGLLVVITAFVIIVCILLRARRKPVHLQPFFLELKPERYSFTVLYNISLKSISTPILYSHLVNITNATLANSLRPCACIYKFILKPNSLKV